MTNGATGKAYLQFLWFSALKQPYRTIADRVNVSEATVLRIVRRVSRAINEEMANQITWPIGSRFRDVVAGLRK